MGSPNDREKMAPAVATLGEFGVEVDERVLSAHRTPDDVAALARSARDEGYAAFICGAGMAAHLAGAVAAHTTLPVVGVPAVGRRPQRRRRPLRHRADAAGACRWPPSPSTAPERRPARRADARHHRRRAGREAGRPPPAPGGRGRCQRPTDAQRERGLEPSGARPRPPRAQGTQYGGFFGPLRVHEARLAERRSGTCGTRRLRFVEDVLETVAPCVSSGECGRLGGDVRHRHSPCPMGRSASFVRFGARPDR